MNFPVNRPDLSVAKNVHNPISIFVNDIDRKPVPVLNAPVLHVTDRRTRRVLLTKPLVLADEKKARYTATITPEDIRAIEVGVYTYLVVHADADGNEVLLFSDRDRSEIASFEVREGPLPPPVEPHVFAASDFLVRTNSLNIGEIERYSGAVPGAAGAGNLTSIQSYTIAMNRFTGIVTLQGSLDMSAPDDDGQWFDIATHAFDAETGIVGFTATANPVWARFKIVEEITLDLGDDTAPGCGCAVPAPGEAPRLVNPIEWPPETPRGVQTIVYRS